MCQVSSAGSCQGNGAEDPLCISQYLWLGSKQESLDKQWRVASDGEGVKGVLAGGVSIPYRNTDLT